MSSEPNEKTGKEFGTDFNVVTKYDIDSFIDAYLGDSFCTFKSKNDIIYLIYTNRKKSIIFFDLNNNKRINEIKEAHKAYISNFKYYYDNIGKRELLISISCEDSNIKLWNINNFECVYNFEKIYDPVSATYSAVIFEEKGANYLITGNCNWDGDSENIKIFDLEGKEISTIDNKKDGILFLDMYYDEEKSKKYIITGTRSCIKTYDYDEKKQYREYCDKTFSYHISIVTFKDENIVKMVESSNDGFIRIWNFHSGQMLKKIAASQNWLYGICLWNEQYLFVGSTNHFIMVVDLKNGKVVNQLQGHDKPVFTIQKINIPQLGDCLVSQGYKDAKIKIWSNAKA